MSAIKLILTCLLFIISSTFYGQLDPISDLEYQQNYFYQNFDCPSFNCFELSWSAPNSSTDTLLGYTVYRNADLWIFTEATEVTCSGNATCAYSDFYDPLPFWIKVKALYNIDSTLSIASDSVFVGNLMITVDEFEESVSYLLQNPVTLGDNISLLIPSLNGRSCSIQIRSLEGKLITEQQTKQNGAGFITIPTTTMSQGLYMIEIDSKDLRVIQKIVLE